MPNWCEGSLKVRGKPADILRFVKEGLNVYTDSMDAPMDKDLWLKIKNYGNEVIIFFDYNNIPKYSSIYIEGTVRAFILWESLNDIFVDVTKQIEMVPFGFKQAWGINPEEFVPIADKYDLDIRLYGIENGMGFVQDYEILDRGQNIINRAPIYASYDEYEWDCPFPWMGG